MKKRMISFLIAGMLILCPYEANASQLTDAASESVCTEETTTETSVDETDTTAGIDEENAVTETETQAPAIDIMTEPQATTESDVPETEPETEAPVTYDGLTTIDGKLYYYQDGKMCYGLQSIKNTDGTTSLYYFKKDGSAFTKGELTITDENGESTYYYFQTDGTANNHGFLTTSTQSYVDADGEIVDARDGSGKIFYYYFQQDGTAFTDGLLRFMNRNNKEYTFYFQENGQAYTQGFIKAEAWHYADINQNIQDQSAKYGTSNYFYFQTNGQAFTKGLLQFVHTDGKTYVSYFGTNGAAYTNGYKPTTTWWAADKNGKITNKAGTTKTTYYYYFKSNGLAFTQGLLEFVNTNSKTYYFYFQANGQAYTKGYLSTGTYHYAATPSSVENKADGTKRYYYFQTNGQAYTKGLKKFTHTNGKTYQFYFQANGQAYTKGWLTVNNNKYYFTTNGQGYFGLKKISGTNYYFNSTTGIYEWTTRKYQNPSGYCQISDNITLTGGGYNLSVGYEGLKVRAVIKRLGIGSGIGMGGAYYSSYVYSQVKKFQTNNGLSATGIVNLATWKAMGFTESEWYSLSQYVSPSQISIYSSKSDCIEAMIDRAYDYLGDDYVIGASAAPGQGCDCSGLVMQALYAAGIDMQTINPVTHAQPGHEYESRNIWTYSGFKHVSYSDRQRGDLVIYQSSSGVVIHVAIYLGNNRVIESWPNTVVTASIINSQHANVKGIIRVFN